MLRHLHVKEMYEHVRFYGEIFARKMLTSSSQCTDSNSVCCLPCSLQVCYWRYSLYRHTQTFLTKQPVDNFESRNFTGGQNVVIVLDTLTQIIIWRPSSMLSHHFLSFPILKSKLML